MSSVLRGDYRYVELVLLLDPAIGQCRDGEDSTALLLGSDRWSMCKNIESPVVEFIV